MRKARITSPEGMSEDQIREDIAMSPLERLELAFKLSDFALEIQRNQEPAPDEPSSIEWIELRKISPKDDKRNTD